MDKYRIDSHKLVYHVSRVNNWLKGEIVYPIYMEVSPAGACNHRCVYCGLDFMGYQPKCLQTDLLKERISELAGLGLKSIMYAGEGEPFLHKDMAGIINHTKKSGISAAVATNGVLFTKDTADSVLGSMEWVKVSLDAASAQTYADIHRSSLDDFDKVIKNLSYAVKLRDKKKYACTLGAQFLLLPQNCREAVAVTAMARDIGLDYLIIKPYSQHTQSKTTVYSGVKYADYEYLRDELEKFSTDNFNVIFRLRTMKKWDRKERGYKSCFALPFWSYIDASGSVWGCSVYLGDKNFLYGNIYEEGFQQIWEGRKRLRSLRFVEQELDACDCRVNCRMDEVNEYLWELKNPPEHVNFI